MNTKVFILTNMLQLMKLQKLMLLVIVILMVFTLLGCCPARLTVSGSGIMGIVMIGPITPVESQGQTNEKPFAEATIIVWNAETNQEITRFNVNSDGTFKHDLSPGKYVLEPINSNNQGGLPYADHVDVMVSDGHYTDVTIVFDSGIR